MKSKFLLFLLLQFGTTLVISQPFTMTYDSDINSGAADIIELENSDIIIGSSKGFAIGNSKFNINRFNAEGSHLWNFREGYPFDNVFSSVIEDYEKNIFLGGSSSLNQIQTSKAKSYIIKTKPNSDTIWTRYYELQNENRRNTISDLQFLNDSSLICVGAARKENVSESLGLIFNIDSNGELIWDVIEEDLNDLYFEKVLIDADGNSYCIGRVFPANKNRDIAIAKYQSDGTRLWIKNFGGDTQDNLQGVNFLENGNLIVAIGSREVLFPFNFDCGFFQVTPEGDSISYVAIPETEEFANCFDFVGMETMSDKSIRVIRTTRNDDFSK